MPFNLSKRSNVHIGIEMSDFCASAQFTNLPVADIRGVDEIESAGSGFLIASQRPKILFEGHLFYKDLRKLGLAEKAAKAEPTIAYPKWTKVHYIGRDGEYARLAKATELCHKYKISDAIALAAASWGRYQILASNYKASGFNSVEEFVEAMFLDEDNHLEAFVNYLMATNLDDVLRAGNYTLFAARYNGPGYRRNGYHIKLPNAIAKFRKQKINCREILEGEVIDLMPGIRSQFPGETGFKNTSLDDRYLDSEPTVQDFGDSALIAGVDGKNAPEGQQTPAINVQEAGAVVNQAPPAPTETEKKIEAAANLPDTTVNATEKTGVLKKAAAFIGSVITGTIVVPQFITDGISWNVVKEIFGALWSFRYWVLGILIVWFVMNKIESIWLRGKIIEKNTDPTSGNVIAADLSKPSLWSRIKGFIW